MINMRVIKLVWLLTRSSLPQQTYVRVSDKTQFRLSDGTLQFGHVLIVL